MEQALIAAATPDFNYLKSHVYDGFNCAASRYIPLPATKFRKAFFQRDGVPYGLNQFVAEDDDDFTGEWRMQVKQGEPVEGGFFRVAPVSGTGRLAPYQHLIGLNYNVDPNPRWHRVMRSIYDVIGLPNAEDYEVILGKAYVRALPNLRLFATYFVLGHRAVYSRR